MANRPTLDRVWAMLGTKKDPGSAKYQLGWGPEIPTYEVLNFLQYRIDLAMLAQTERGAPEWGKDIAYLKGALAWDNTDSRVYIAKVANPNRNLAPSANPGQWDVSSIQISAQAFAELGQKFDAHVARKDNPHGVTADQAGTYTKAVIDQKVSASNSAISAHIADKNNPHGDTAEKIGAVPITGGSYQGEVTFDKEETKINPGAGDTVVRGNANFAGLRMGKVYLGIGSSGRALVQNDAGVDYLMNEVEYLAKRATIEKEYAAPVPDYEIDTLSDIHPRQGFGFTELFRNSEQTYVNKMGQTVTALVGTPRHTEDGLLLDKQYREYFEVDAEYNMAGFQSFTLFMEFKWLTAQHNEFFRTITADAFLIWAGSDGVISVQLKDNGGQIRNFKIGNLTVGMLAKVAVSFDGTTIRTYLNGTAGAFGDIAFTKTGTFTKAQFGYVPNAGSPKTEWALRKFQTYAKALTAKQISTL